MQALNRRSDWKAFLQAGGHLGLLIATGALVWYASDKMAWWVYLPLLFVYGTFYAFVLNGSHELSHNTVFKTRGLNAFFLSLFAFLGWRNQVMFWTSHEQHHKFTLYPPNDLEVALPIRLTLMGFFKVGFVDVWRLRDTLKTTVRISLGKLEGEWEHHLFPDTDTDNRRALVNSSRFLLAGHATIVGVSIYFDLWLLPVLTTFGSFYGGWLRYLCNNTQHAGLQDKVPDFRCSCRTVILNPFLKFLYWQMNYHIEHHMYAAIPCYNLGRLHREIQEDLPLCPVGLWAGWKDIIEIQKRQKVEPDYQYAPDLPVRV
jgi:fatty acid desaturase